MIFFNLSAGQAENRRGVQKLNRGESIFEKVDFGEWRGYIDSMLLAIDIGNSRVHVGVYDGTKLMLRFSLVSDRKLDADKYTRSIEEKLKEGRLDIAQVDRVAVASVVPELTPVLSEISKKLFGTEPLVISPEIKLPIKLGYSNPLQLGADRIANAVAGFKKFGGPLIIVDYGTAINFEVLTDNGIFVGGVIAPGPESSLAGLTNRAARLFDVKIEEQSRVIARDTENAIKSGLFYGTIGQVDGIIKAILTDLTVPARVIATGGYANLFAPNSKYIETTHPNLTLDGIRIIADYQSGQ